MIMQNKKMMALLALSAIALISLIYGIVTPSKVRQRARLAAKKEAAAAPQQPLEPIKVLTASERYPKRGSYSEWGKSPFVALAPQEKGAMASLVLGGIAWDVVSPKAVINDTIVVVGDMIEGRKVVSIQPDSVILNDGQKEIRLGLEPLDTKKT